MSERRPVLIVFPDEIGASSSCGGRNVTVTRTGHVSPATPAQPIATTIDPERRLVTVRPIVTRVGAGVTVVLSLLASFEPSGSDVEDEAVGRTVTVPRCARPVRSATSIEAAPPFASVSAPHVTAVPSRAQRNAEPSVCAAPISVMPDGIRIDRRGCDASDGPPFRSRTWYVTTSPARTGSGESPTPAERSAEVATVVAVLALSFAPFGSASPCVAEAVSESVDPLGLSDATCTTSVKVRLAPLARLAAVHLTVPPEPTAGVVHEKPDGASTDTNVVPDGRSSVSATSVASEGPLFASPSVYVRSVPAVTGSGESLALADTSAEVATVVVLLALSLPVFGSPSSCEMLAVFDNVDPLGRSGATCTTSVKVPPAPFDMLEAVQLTVPPEPTLGVVHVKPLGAVTDTKLVLAGRVSPSVTLAAEEGPLFETPIV